jgi:GGDEF domain-containing protein
MLTQHSTPTLDQLLIQIREQNALIAELSHDPGFGVPTAAYTRRQIDRLPSGRVGIAVGDIKNLKQWNSATGSQERTDELFRPALHVRADDVLILGKRDSGDQFILVGHDVQGATARIAQTLRYAPTTEGERARYVRGVCVKFYGPWLGRVVSRVASVSAYPEIDWQMVHDIDVRDIHAAASAAERRLFGDKAARLTFGVLVKERARC